MKIVLLDTGTMGSDIDYSSLDCLGECIKYHNTQPDEVPERIKLQNLPGIATHSGIHSLSP